MDNNIASRIIEYECGELEEEATVALFQNLVDSGLAWQLQGHYGRTAAAFLEAGLITREPKTTPTPGYEAYKDQA